MDWFLYDNGLRHERVKYLIKLLFALAYSSLENENGWMPQKKLESLFQHHSERVIEFFPNKMPKFHLVSWNGDFAEIHSFHKIFTPRN